MSSARLLLRVHVEEASTEAALQVLLPRMVPADVKFKLINHNSKKNLLAQLPIRLKGYANWRANWRVLVLVDRDQDDCHTLKTRLEDAARKAGLNTKSRPGANGRFCVVNRVVIEELEAWFFGDPAAIGAAFPRAGGEARRLAARGPDTIPGGTWEALQRILHNSGELARSSRLPKIATARAIANHMQPTRNASPSFRAFQDGLNALLAV